MCEKVRMRETDMMRQIVRISENLLEKEGGKLTEEKSDEKE